MQIKIRKCKFDKAKLNAFLKASSTESSSKSSKLDSFDKFFKNADLSKATDDNVYFQNPSNTKSNTGFSFNKANNHNHASSSISSSFQNAKSINTNNSFSTASSFQSAKTTTNNKNIGFSSASSSSIPSTSFQKAHQTKLQNNHNPNHSSSNTNGFCLSSKNENEKEKEKENEHEPKSNPNTNNSPNPPNQQKSSLTSTTQQTKFKTPTPPTPSQSQSDPFCAFMNAIPDQYEESQLEVDDIDLSRFQTPHKRQPLQPIDTNTNIITPLHPITIIISTKHHILHHLESEHKQKHKHSTN